MFCVQNNAVKKGQKYFYIKMFLKTLAQRGACLITFIACVQCYFMQNVNIKMGSAKIIRTNAATIFALR